MPAAPARNLNVSPFVCFADDERLNVVASERENVCGEPGEARCHRDLRHSPLRIADDSQRGGAQFVANARSELAECRLGQCEEVLVLRAHETLPSERAGHAGLNRVRVAVMPVVVHPQHDHPVVADERALERRDAVVRSFERPEVILVAEERGLVRDYEIRALSGRALKHVERRPSSSRQCRSRACPGRRP